MIFSYFSWLSSLRFYLINLFFLWSRFNEFGDNGGRAAKSLRPKFNAFVSHVTTHTGQQLPPVDVSAFFMSSQQQPKNLISDWVLLFSLQTKLLVAAAIALKGIGGLLFVSGSSLGAYLLVCSNCSFIEILVYFSSVLS